MNWTEIKDWDLLWSRGMSIQKSQDYIQGAMPSLEKVFGKGLGYMLMVQRNSNIEFFLSKKDYKEYLDYYENKISVNFLDKMKSEIISVQNLINEINLKTQNIINFSNEEIVLLLKELIGLRIKIYPVLWHIIIFENRLEELFEKKIKKYNLNPKIFLNFVKPTFVHKEMIALKNVKSEEELQKHTEEYSFMPMYDVDYKPYDIEFFRKRMNEKIEIPDFNKINLEIANELNKVDEKDKFFFEFFSFMVWFKDERSYYRSKDSFYFRRLYLEISKRLNLTIKELLNMPYEVLYESILSGKRINSNVKGYFAYRKEMDPIFEKDVNKIISLFDLNDNFVKGISAEKGNVKGKVVVLLNAKDIDKVKEGDILVSPATRPDFIVAMRKALAIITDEGGMTSHAAIVSRELGIPCVVGTKYATKIFKDGDLVEIKDDIVRKIIRGHK